MALWVEYFRDRLDPTSKCWALLPLPLGLIEVTALAHDGFADVKLLGARGFRIINDAGEILAEEPAGPNAP